MSYIVVSEGIAYGLFLDKEEAEIWADMNNFTDNEIFPFEDME